MNFNTDLILALAMITSPDPVSDGQEIPRSACQQIAVQMQLLDSAELSYYFRPTDMDASVLSEFSTVRRPWPH